MQHHSKDNIDDKESTKRICKFCFADEIEQNESWLSPCHCSGSMQWVHRSCFERWLQSAPIIQRSMCTTCRYVYNMRWSMKHWRRWQLPSISLGKWEMIEMILDIISTLRLTNAIIDTCRHYTASKLASLLLKLFVWRLLIYTDNRVAFYMHLGRRIVSSIVDWTIVDCPPKVVHH